MEFILQKVIIPMDDIGTPIPKKNVSRSKRLLKPQLLPHQYRGVEFAATLHVTQVDSCGNALDSRRH